MYLPVLTRTGRLRETLGDLQLESRSLALSLLLSIPLHTRTVQASITPHFKLSFRLQLIKRTTFSRIQNASALSNRWWTKIRDMNVFFFILRKEQQKRCFLLLLALPSTLSWCLLYPSLLRHNVGFELERKTYAENWLQWTAYGNSHPRVCFLTSP